MASTVATPWKALGGHRDVDDMTSSSGVGTSNIQLTFGSDRDIDGAARDVQGHRCGDLEVTRTGSYERTLCTAACTNTS